ncbi:MAG: hypothetical protein ACP5NQ_07250 [Vulcanisaeta sp.]
MDIASVVIVLVGLLVSIFLAEASIDSDCVIIVDYGIFRRYRSFPHSPISILDVLSTSYLINTTAITILQSIHHPFSLWFLSIPYGRMSIFEIIYAVFILFILTLIDTAAAVMYIIIRAKFSSSPSCIVEIEYY